MASPLVLHSPTFIYVSRYCKNRLRFCPTELLFCFPDLRTRDRTTASLFSWSRWSDGHRRVSRRYRLLMPRVIAARFDLHSRRNGLEVDSRLLAVCYSTAVMRRGMPIGYAAPPSLVLNKPTLIRSRGVCRYIPSPRVASVLELILSNWRELLAHASEHSH